MSEVSARIDRHIRGIGGWRGETLARVRALIHEALPDVQEEWKWDIPVWSHGGILCTGEVYKAVVKLTFAKGAALPDPATLFNSSLGGNTRRAIDLREGESLNSRTFKTLIKAAAAHNAAGASTRPADKKAAAKEPAAKTPAAAKAATKVRLLSGGNPQIAKGDGDAPVQAYLAAMPGWTQDVGRRLDALIVRAVPKVQKAVKWNSPFYGLAGKGWFLSFHVFTRYVKVTFFRGRDLKPMPPEPSKDPQARYVHLTPTDFDDARLTSWVKQAAKKPGWIP